MNTVRYQLSVDDLVDARGYVHNSLPFVKLIRLALFIVLAGCILSEVYLAFYRDWNGMLRWGGWLVLDLGLVIWSVVANRWLLPPSVRKQLARNKGLQGEQIVYWDAERIVFASVYGEARWPWEDFRRWQESPAGLLLWQSNQLYFYVPKRVLSDIQVSEIRAYLVEAVSRSKSPQQTP